MKVCAYCGCSNYDHATACRKCDASFASPGTLYQGRAYLFGPRHAHHLRSRALSLIALGLLMRVYWGGYGPWPVIDYPPFAHIRPWLEPLLLYGGAGLYLVGWIARFV
jgi:hypothetical protein